jgi:hypothetical protein
MSDSLERVISILRRTGLPDVAQEAKKVLSDPVDKAELDQFALAHGLSAESLADRLGGSP